MESIKEKNTINCDYQESQSLPMIPIIFQYKLLNSYNSELLEKIHSKINKIFFFYDYKIKIKKLFTQHLMQLNKSPHLRFNA
jgi:hypothetical protein